MRINKLFRSKTIFLIFILAYVSNSYAADGVFDSIVKSFYSTGINVWYPKAVKIAAYIFWTISLLEFGWMVAFKKLFAGQLEKLWYVVISRAVISGLLFVIFVKDIDLYLGIMKWLLKIGADLGGGLGTVPSGDVYSVSGLFDLMWNAMAYPMGIIIGLAATSGILSSATGTFLYGIAGVIILAMLIACVSVMWLLVRAWIVIFGGFILVGFIGSNWTRNYWQKYLSYVVGVGLSLFGLGLVLVVISAQWANCSSWLPALPDVKITSFITDTMGVLGTLILRLIVTLGVIFFDVVLIIGAPSIGTQLASGAVNAGLGELIAGAATMVSGGAMAGKVGQGITEAGKAAASGVMGAAGAGKQAAVQSMKDSLKNGIGGGDGNSDDGKFREMAKSQAKESGSKASKEHRAQGFSNAAAAFKGGLGSSSKDGGKFGQHASRTSGGGNTTGASVNTNSPQN